MHGIDEISANGLYDLSINGLDILFINFFPHEVNGLHEFSITGLKILPINVCHHDVRECVELMSESGLPGLNGLWLEYYLNGMNGLNVLGP